MFVFLGSFVISVADFYISEMADVNEQRICIKFCLKLHKTAAETHRMLQEAFGDAAMSQSRTFLWYKRFKDGRESVEDDERSGRPTTGTTPENIAKVQQAIRADRRLTIHDLCVIVGLSYGTVQRILSDILNMRRIAAKFVPRLLNEEQKEHRVDVCFQLKEQARKDPDFISKVVTGDESWFYGYDPETKQQSSQWKSPNSPRPKKARQVRSHVKSMMIIFFDIEGVVHKEFLPHGETVNGKFYCEVLKRLRESIRRKRPDKWLSNDWFLHHDNAPSHTALVVRQFLASKNITVIPHPPYSPDLAPCDYFLFPKLKSRMKGRRFDTVEEIQAEAQEVLNALTPGDFQRGMESWKQRWDRCVHAQGSYFEGDGDK